MKKVLYITTVSRTINAFLIPHIEMLLENGYQVDCACSIDKPVDELLKNKGVNIFEVPFSRNPFNVGNIKALREIVKIQKKNKYDIVHVHTPVAAFFSRAGLRSSNVEIIYTAHGFHFYKGAPLINWLLYYPLEKIAARWTNKIITINKEDYERAKQFKIRNGGKILLMNGVGIKKDQYLLDNFDKEKYRKSLNINNDEFVILVLADINKNKNHIQLIKAMKVINKENNNIKVICAGDGPLKDKLSRLVKKLKLEDKVNFLGFRTDVNELLQISDCIGLFSQREGLGKCLLEGMVTGKALIATNTRGPRELIENNKNGFLVDIGDYNNTAVCIEKLSKDKSLINKFKYNSNIKLEKYLLGSVLEFLEGIY